MGHLYRKKNGVWTEDNAASIFRKEGGRWVEGTWSGLDIKKYVFEILPSKNSINYVSLGDSIAAGQSINDDWSARYGEESQYGANGNQSTTLVPGSYTALIRDELVGIYGEDRVSVTSFARSGDTVRDLMEKLGHETVRNAIEKADLVTVCIGANDVLQPAMSHLNEYINTGSLSDIESTVEANLATLADDSQPTSYTSLFNKLAEINPNAKYIFTSIYNPYKYLYLHTGHNGFFGPLLSTIPEIRIDVDEVIEDLFNIDDLGYFDITKWSWVSIELNANIDSLIKDGLLNTPVVQMLFDRVNGLGEWAEKYVEGTSNFNGLNRVLRDRINAYRVTNPNFMIADTKAIFDLFPDRTDSSSDVDYSDLVNVEFTRTFDTAKMDWGSLWKGSDATTFWTNLVFKHLYWTNALPSTNVWDYVSFDLAGFASDLIDQIATKVVMPDVDPHPERQGHEVLKRSFTNVLGLVKCEGNGGECVAGTAALTGGKITPTSPTRSGYEFAGWCTDSGLQQALDPNRTDFVDHDSNVTLADLVTGNTVKPKTPKITTIYAKWSAES